MLWFLVDCRKCGYSGSLVTNTSECCSQWYSFVARFRQAHTVFGLIPQIMSKRPPIGRILLPCSHSNIVSASNEFLGLPGTTPKEYMTSVCDCLLSWATPWRVKRNKRKWKRKSPLSSRNEAVPTGGKVTWARKAQAGHLASLSDTFI